MKTAKEPMIHPTAYIAPGAVVRGDVTLQEGANVWHNSVVIGDNVNIGHNCIIHGCTIEDCVTVGMGAIIMDGARIGSGSFIGAGAVVTENKIIPPNSVVVGMPAKVIKETTEAQRESTLESCRFYAEEAEMEKAREKE